MKKIVAILALIFTSFSAVAGEFSQPYISVFGSAKTEVVPDVMRWSLKVDNKGQDLSAVSKTHTDIVKNVISAVRNQGVDKSRIQTTGMSFGENFVYRNNSQIREGYVASTNIFFDLTDFDKYEALWLALSKIKNVNVSYVNYGYSKTLEAQQETRIKALQDAKSKANAMAVSMGQKLADVLVIADESSSYAQPPSYRMEAKAYASGGGSGGAASPGLIPINVKVKLVMGLKAK